MTTHVAIVFPNDDKAHAALRVLWHMDEDAALTVHGAALLRRDDLDHVRVAETALELGPSAAVGAGVGALLGLLAGPAVVAAGIAGMSLGTAAGVGALAGGAIGLTADAVADGRRDTAASEAFFTLRTGQSAIVADLSEDVPMVLDDAMATFDGVIHRREETETPAVPFGAAAYDSFLFPYYHEPVFA